MSDQFLRIYGASDDLVEIEGAVSDELNVYDKVNLLVRIDMPSYSQECYVTAEYTRGWYLTVGQITGQPEHGGSLNVRLVPRPDRDNDPCIEIIGIPEIAHVKVTTV